VEFKDATERRAFYLAQIEEVERRRNATSNSNRVLRRIIRAQVRVYVHSTPGSSITEIAAALKLTPQQVWETGLQREFIQTRSLKAPSRYHTRWWPSVPSRKEAGNDQAV